MSITQYLGLPFAQHALAAAALGARACGLIGPFVITRGMAFAVHGTSELAFTGGFNNYNTNFEEYPTNPANWGTAAVDIIAVIIAGDRVGEFRTDDA